MGRALGVPLSLVSRSTAVSRISGVEDKRPASALSISFQSVNHDHVLLSNRYQEISAIQHRHSAVPEFVCNQCLLSSHPENVVKYYRVCKLPRLVVLDDILEDGDKRRE